MIKKLVIDDEKDNFVIEKEYPRTILTGKWKEEDIKLIIAAKENREARLLREIRAVIGEIQELRRKLEK